MGFVIGMLISQKIKSMEYIKKNFHKISSKDTSIYFTDIFGAKNAKQYFYEIISNLKKSKGKYGVSIKILLTGCSKEKRIIFTKAFAKKSDLTIFHVFREDLILMHLEDTITKIKKLF